MSRNHFQKVDQNYPSESKQLKKDSKRNPIKYLRNSQVFSHKNRFSRQTSLVKKNNELKQKSRARKFFPYQAITFSLRGLLFEIFEMKNYTRICKLSAKISQKLSLMGKT